MRQEVVDSPSVEYIPDLPIGDEDPMNPSIDDGAGNIGGTDNVSSASTATTAARQLGRIRRDQKTRKNRRTAQLDPKSKKMLG